MDAAAAAHSALAGGPTQPPGSASAAPQLLRLPLLLALCLASAVWALVQHSRSQQLGLAPLRQQRWARSATVCLLTALASHVALLVAHFFIHSEQRDVSVPVNAAGSALCILLLVLLSAWRTPRRLWEPALLLLAAAGAYALCLADAVLTCVHHPHKPGSGWVEAHIEGLQLWATAVQLGAALAASGALLMAAGAAAHAEEERRGGGWEALPASGEDEEAGRQRRGSSKGARRPSRRWQLVHGTLRYVWPDSPGLQLRLAACFLLILLGRVANIATPLAFKHVVDTLGRASMAAGGSSSGSGGGEETLGSRAAGLRALCCSAFGGDAGGISFGTVFWPWTAAYLGLFFLQGGSGKGGLGFLSNARDLLWIPITQRAYKRVSLHVFEHLLSLDHTYHLNRNTGKVMRILDRGTSSVQDVMGVVLFNIIPQAVDVIAACGFIAARLNLWTALIVAATVCTYLPMTFAITEWRGKVRKRMNNLDNDKEGKASDLLLNYETVKSFGNEQFELKQFGEAISRFQAAEALQLAAICLLNMAQGAVVFGGMAAGLSVCIRRVVAGELTVGDTVLFIALIGQLLQPLAFFSSYYRQLQKGFVDMENLFDLLHTPPTVADQPGARPLAVTAGAVSFRGVSFYYTPAAPVLRNLSFEAPGGSTLALVGSTGSGKSTVLRLVLRFWDPCEGCVLVDGVNIATCTLASLRACMAVVAQDCVLFNETIQYNIRYGRPSASDAEVEEAARIAQIHESVVQRFPHGYATVVGERGLRLSGGEKQRVAFARAILRRPRILLLDEATSALDTVTERAVQASLSELHNSVRCTTLVVAHRLSTVADCDQILVLELGQLAERGTHAQLLAAGGAYAQLWQRQQEFSSQLEPPSAASGEDQRIRGAAAAHASGLGTGGSSKASRLQSEQDLQLERGGGDE